jgi:hypothetical protein
VFDNIRFSVHTKIIAIRNQAVSMLLSLGIDLNATKGVANQNTASISSYKILNNCLPVPNCYDGALGLRTASVCSWLWLRFSLPSLESVSISSQTNYVSLPYVRLSIARKDRQYFICVYTHDICFVLLATLHCVCTGRIGCGKTKTRGSTKIWCITSGNHFLKK